MPVYDTKNILVGAGILKVDGVEVGFTEDGVTITYAREYLDIEADQSINILGKRKIKEDITITTNLLEATLENLKMVLDIPQDVVEGDGVKSLSFGGDKRVTEHTLEFIGNAPNGKTRRLVIWKAVSIETGEHAYKKGDKTLIPVTFQAIADMTKPEGERLGYYEDEI